MRFLVNLLNNVFIKGRISNDDISDDSENEDNDRTPTNEKDSEEDDVTPNEAINDITDMKNTLEQVKQAARGEYLDKKVIDDIKESYSSFFDEDSGNATEKESFEEIIDYLEGELSTSLNSASLAGLDKALEEVYNKTYPKYSDKTSEEPLNKKVESSETTESAPEASSSAVKSSEGLSPLDYVLDKQSTDPLDPTDDLD